MICRTYPNDYCREDISLIENYEEAVNSRELWVCHHRLETHDKWGNPRNREDFIDTKTLRALKLYYMRPASELIFMRKEEHNRLHRPGYGYKFTEEQRERLSKIKKGINLTNEHKSKISESAINRWALYIMLPNGVITTTRNYHDEHNLKMNVSDMNKYVRNKGYIVDNGVRIPVINLGNQPQL